MAIGPAQIELILTPTGFGPQKCNKSRTIGNVREPACPADPIQIEFWVNQASLRSHKFPSNEGFMLTPRILVHGTCLASKICGRRSGVAKQATVIPVVVDETYQSLVTGLEQVLTDIPDRRRKYNQAIAGKTVLCISLSAEIEKRDESYQKMLKIALGGIMKQGVVIVVSAGNYAKFDGFVSIDYPAVLAASDFPLIKVGVVDQQGIVPDWGQEGDVYYCGVGILCAKKSTGGYLTDEEGSSGSVASFAGLIAYMMGKEDPPFDFGDSDVSQYPYIVKNYFTQGQGAFVRPGGSVRVAWNGLDGRVGTQCPLNLKKRQDGQDDDCQSSSTSSSIAPTQTPNSLEEVNLAIYYSVLEPCEGGQSECGLTYYVYVPGDRGLPIQECGGALGQGSDSVQFQLINLTGALENFIYTPSSSPAGTVTRDSLASPVTCSKSWSQAVAWKCISKKRMNVPDNPPIVPHYPVFYNWASCNVYAN